MTRTLSVSVPRDYWLTANRTVVNHAYRRRLITAIHDITAAAARAQSLDAAPGKVVADWTIHYPKGVGEADPTNAHPTCKAILDALVPRYVIKDSSTVVVEERYRRGPNLTQPGRHVVVLTLLDPAEGR